MKKQNQKIDIKVKALFLKSLMGANTPTLKNIIKELNKIIWARRINKIKKFFKHVKKIIYLGKRGNGR